MAGKRPIVLLLNNERWCVWKSTKVHPSGISETRVCQNVMAPVRFQRG